MKMSNELYDKLKWLDLIFLPAIAAFYVALADIWGLPKPTEIAGTISAVIVFIGAVLQISNAKYKKDQTTTNEEAVKD